MDIFIGKSRIKQIAPVIDGEKGIPSLDLYETYVLPGLIDCHTHVGIIEEATGKIGVDNNETSDPITPNLRVIDAVNPMDIVFKGRFKAVLRPLCLDPGVIMSRGAESCN